MPHRPSCRACSHCTIPHGHGAGPHGHGAGPHGHGAGWCRLRQLTIHGELAGELWCHHWTARPPQLPAGGALGGASAPPQASPRLQQLSLEMLLPQLQN